MIWDLPAPLRSLFWIFAPTFMIPKISNPDTTGTPKPTVYQASHPFPQFLHLFVQCHCSGVECHVSSWPTAPSALKCLLYHTPVSCTQQALNRCMIWSEFSSLLPTVLRACLGLMLIKLQDFVLELLPQLKAFLWLWISESMAESHGRDVFQFKPDQKAVAGEGRKTFNL